MPDVEKAAEEAEGAEMDMYAASWVSDGLGDDVSDVRWISISTQIIVSSSSTAASMATTPAGSSLGRGMCQCRPCSGMASSTCSDKS